MARPYYRLGKTHYTRRIQFEPGDKVKTPPGFPHNGDTGEIVEVFDGAVLVKLDSTKTIVSFAASLIEPLEAIEA